MNPESMDEAFGELFESLEAATSAADKVARVRAMADKWEPTFPGIRSEFESMAGLEKLMRKSGPAPQHPAVPPSLPGFAKLTPIGAGGYGVVCRAVQFPFGRQVAVKFRVASASASAEERFEREQRILAGLHHTNIVPVHLSGRHGPYQFFVMKLIDGATLADLVLSLADRTAPPAAISTLADHAAHTADSRSRERTPDSIPTAARTPPPAEGPPASFPAVPPPAYFRSVAAVIAAAADALAHAHANGVIHRDIKPSNIMVGRDGVCSIIDFGLAAVSSADPDSDTPRTGDALTQGALGTTPYMAPEQFHGKPDERSDVWGLGATLYELLTLRRAYPGGAFGDSKRTVPADEPAAPREACGAVPPDLDAICRKALRRDAAERYASPAELADDLRRWQRGEVTAALPRGPLPRAWMWAKRNPSWAGMILTVAAALVVGAFAVSLSAKATAATAKAKAIEAEAATEKTKAEAAEEREKDRQREALVMAIQGRRLSQSTTAGWYDAILPDVRTAAALRNDEPLRTQAVALLTGTNAIARPSLDSIVGSSLAFDARGRMLIGGLVFDNRGKWEVHPTRLREGPLLKPKASDLPGSGPVAFRPDGTALQLAVTSDDRNTLALWDVGAQKLVRHLTVPGAKKTAPLGGVNAPVRQYLALSSDGKFAAAVIQTDDGRLRLWKTIVWDTVTGAVVFTDTPESVPTALAVGAADPNGTSFVATGDKDGKVKMWALPSGESLPTFAVDPREVTALAVGRDVRRGDRRVPVPALRNRLLAVGRVTGRVAVWELESSTIRSFFHGSAYSVRALDFSPDGVTLASGGRVFPRLWDVSTGRMLLQLGTAYDYVNAIKFSADGRTVAFTGYNVFVDHPSGTQVWAVENGRGTQTLRGLSGMVSEAWWSPDGNYVAALSHDWRVGVWDVRTGLLMHAFEVPDSTHIDNATVAFRADSKQVAYAGGRDVFVWDISTGERAHAWPLQEGLTNAILFPSPDKLFVFRYESRDPTKGPYGHPTQNPRILRIRNMLADPNKLILDSDALSWDVRGSGVAAADSCFLADGTVAVGNKKTRFVKAFDAATGAQLWEKASKLLPHYSSGLLPDPKGEFVPISLEPGRTVVVRARTGNEFEAFAVPGASIGTPNGFYLAEDGALFRRGENKRLFRLADDASVGAGTYFDPTGTRVLWPTADGAIRICDLTAVQERLAALGLNW